MVKYPKRNIIISTSYRCFKHFNESLFLSDLAADLESFHLSNNNVNDDFYT